MFFETSWFNSLRKYIKTFGGICNAHLHLDRAGINSIGAKSLRLLSKQNLIKTIHDSDSYSYENLEKRAEYYIGWLKQLNVKTAWTCVDTSMESEDRAFEVFAKQRILQNFDLRIAAYAPDKISEQLWSKVLKKADFICSLPERAENFDAHCEKIFDAGIKYNKEMHFHLDQSANRNSCETERLLDILGSKTIKKIWVIHALSPSFYDNKRFFRLVDRLGFMDIGIICCPSAAIGMHRNRQGEKQFSTNSIARIKDFYDAGIPIRIGSDNVDDMFSPSTGLDLMQEIFLASHALRWYDEKAWAKMATNSAEKMITAPCME